MAKIIILAALLLTLSTKTSISLKCYATFNASQSEKEVVCGAEFKSCGKLVTRVVEKTCSLAPASGCSYDDDSTGCSCEGDLCNGAMGIRGLTLSALLVLVMAATYF